MEGKFVMQEKLMTAEELAEAMELESVGIGRLWADKDPYMEPGFAALVNRDPEEMAFDGITADALVAGSISSRGTASDDPEKAAAAWAETWAKAEALAKAWNLVPRLLATVDALTERAERAEGELASCERTNEQLQAERHKVFQDLAVVEKQRDEALADLKAERKAHADTARLAEQRLAERNSLQGELDQALAALERVEGELRDVTNSEAVRQSIGQTIYQKRDEAIALADARGRALEGCIKALENGRYRREERQGALDALTVAWDALSTPAPEAMRRQLEREAEIQSELGRIRHVLAGFVGELTDHSVPIIGTKDSWLGRVQERIWAHRRNEAEMVAMIGALRGALEEVVTYNNLPWEEKTDDRSFEVMKAGREALLITPPQALAKQRERMEKALKVVEAAKGLVNPPGKGLSALRDLESALAEFDAERGQG